MNVIGKNVTDTGLASGSFDVSSNSITVTRVASTPTPTCTDGIQNGTETGVDCGGSCPPCQTNVTYCSATGADGAEGITNVVFAGINKTSIRNTTGYDNFTSTSANVTAGTSHNLRITIIGYNGGTDDEIYAFFDWNQDGDFADSGETFALTKTTGLIGDVSVAVPQTAKTGSTRMRLLVSYYDIEDNPCDTGTNDVQFGEYEDYTVNVAANKSSITYSGKLFSIAPVPVSNGELNITFNTPKTGVARIQIYNIYGKKVTEFNELIGIEKTKTIQLNSDELITGFYLVKATLGDKTGLVRVIVE